MNTQTVEFWWTDAFGWRVNAFGVTEPPINTDRFSREQTEELRIALETAHPEALVVHIGDA